jgi:hypothetical protein
MTAGKPSSLDVGLLQRHKYGHGSILHGTEEFMGLRLRPGRSFAKLFCNLLSLTYSERQKKVVIASGIP